MISEKNKRKIIYNDTVFYWYIKIDDKGHRIHMLSEDKSSSNHRKNITKVLFSL